MPQALHRVVLLTAVADAPRAADNNFGTAGSGIGKKIGEPVAGNPVIGIYERQPLTAGFVEAAVTGEGHPAIDGIAQSAKAGILADLGAG